MNVADTESKFYNREIKPLILNSKGNKLEYFNFLRNLLQIPNEYMETNGTQDDPDLKAIKKMIEEKKNLKKVQFKIIFKNYKIFMMFYDILLSDDYHWALGKLNMQGLSSSTNCKCSKIWETIKNFILDKVLVRHFTSFFFNEN